MKNVAVLAIVAILCGGLVFVFLTRMLDAGNGRPAPPDHSTATITNGEVAFRGGYETDSRDHGRPVALIAAALGVESQVFRDAFRGVSPSQFGPPTSSRAHANKAVLMDALGKHGVTNDRLDEVSNYYRYDRGRGELWNYTPATAEAVIQDDKIVDVKLTNPGSGYLQVPAISIAGYPDVKLTATLKFSKDFGQNGSLAELKIVSP